MRRLALLLVILAVSLSVFAGVPAAQPVQAQESDGCMAVNSPILDAIYFSAVLSLYDFAEGDTIVVTVDFVQQTPGGQTGASHAQQVMAMLDVNGSVVDSTVIPGSMTYTFAADAAGATVQWYPSTEMVLAWTAQCTNSPVTVAGCDTHMYLPSWAVVGAFLSDTQTYWAPDLSKATSPPIVIPAGKTAWVLGQDSGKQFYKIIWACSMLWVPTESMGPNFDEVWNGAPLPTDVVE